MLDVFDIGVVEVVEDIELLLGPEIATLGTILCSGTDVADKFCTVTFVALLVELMLEVEATVVEAGLVGAFDAF